MTSFMIRDILNLNPKSNCDTKQNENSMSVHPVTGSSGQRQLHAQSVSTICVSRDLTQLSRDTTPTPDLSYSLVEKRHPTPAASISESSETAQNSWSRNKMKVRTVFTDIQR